MATKIIDLNQIWKILRKVISGKELNYSEQCLLYRFVDKLTDSEQFEFIVNRNFNAIQLKYYKDDIEDKLKNRIEIELQCEFRLIPYKSTEWVLYRGNEVFLDKLDTKLARRIAYDINVAYGIQVSRELKSLK